MVPERRGGLDREASVDPDRGTDDVLRVETGGDRRVAIVITSATSITATATTTETILATSSTARRTANDEIRSVAGAGVASARSVEGAGREAGIGGGAGVEIAVAGEAVARVATGVETGKIGGDSRGGGISTNIFTLAEPCA